MERPPHPSGENAKPSSVTVVTTSATRESTHETSRGDGPAHTPKERPSSKDESRRRGGNSTARSQRRRRLLSRALGILLLLLLIGGLIWAFAPTPVPVETTLVTRGPLQVIVEEDGFTRVRDRYVVTTPQAGFLERITLRAGDRVEQGDVVARLTPPVSNLLDPRSRDEAQARLGAAQAAFRQAQASVSSARAAHAQARQELERQQSLAQQGATTERELDQARFQERQLRAELESARFAVQVAQEQVAQAQAVLARAQGGSEGTQSEALEVRAPTSGTVLTVQRESAGAVTMGEQLLEIGNLEALEVVVDVLTTEAVTIEPGDPVELVRWGGGRPGEVTNGATNGAMDGATEDGSEGARGDPSDTPSNAPSAPRSNETTTERSATLAGRVRRVEPGAFTKTSALGVDEQRVNVVIDFEAAPDARPPLGDGYRVEARIVVWQGEDVMQVPPGAVHRIDGEWGAYVVEDGTARLRTVTVGRRGDTGYEIRDGLAPGEELVLYPSDDVVDGASVRRR